ncbi:MAG: type II toxin-antitoxin system PemK/MazF family toxin [Azospirillaceae bacterium]|nr:type II toxin-antitoxin system PemK/MazF family toxin [Azospirillaceae bacterium]
MPIPAPEPGLVISYAYLWDHEAQRGQEEGRKDRPCVVTLAVQRQQYDETLVTVLPITHNPPGNASAAVEIPLSVKRLLGLDDARSWVVVSEGDQFVWPGYDLRKAGGNDRYDYGFLPPNFFRSILATFRAWHETHKVTSTTR